MPLTLIKAVAAFEGFNVPGSRPNRNNNPGDLEYHPWLSLFGGVKGSEPRFAIFPSRDKGFAALQHLFTFPLYFGKSLEVAFNIYAPPVENNTNAYLEFVCLHTGYKPTDVIDSKMLEV